uniref:Uncharacterized protein n=1 Tax=Cacopsylla melanoneura TaxID=428564 RepID=A0A8D8XVG5_9HEMI
MTSYQPLPVLFSVLLIPASYSTPARYNAQQHVRPNLNPNHEIVMESRDVPYRPDLTRDDPEWPLYDARKQGQPVAAAAHKEDPEEVSNARADDIGDDVDQNQIMNEISNIIQQNNQKMSHIARHKLPETPVLDDNTQDRAVPIVNEKDPNNPEQFERLPRVNERIPIVNREIIKVPNIKQRIPGFVNQQGIVYNVPKVHQRIPLNNQQAQQPINADLNIKQHIDNELKQIKLNDLEDEHNVDAVINNLDHNMNIARPGVHAPKIFGESIGEHYRPDMGPDDSKWPMYDAKHDNVHARHGEHQVQAEGLKSKVAQSGAQRVHGGNAEHNGDLIHHHHQDHHLHRGADMGNEQHPREPIGHQPRPNQNRQHQGRNGKLKNVFRNYRANGLNILKARSKLSRNYIQNQNLHQILRKTSGVNIANVGKRNANPMEIETRIQALAEDIRHRRPQKENNLHKLEALKQKQRLEMVLKKQQLSVPPQQLVLGDLVNENNVRDVISALDDRVEDPLWVQAKKEVAGLENKLIDQPRKERNEEHNADLVDKIRHRGVIQHKEHGKEHEPNKEVNGKHNGKLVHSSHRATIHKEDSSKIHK